MRQIFSSETQERKFRQEGFVVVDLLDPQAIDDLWSFYSESFCGKRAVVAYAEQLPYYISVFDKDSQHKRAVDTRISSAVEPRLQPSMCNYRVFYSNFMIKFPGDGQIEAHQDFNFVDESRHTAFNLWCPLVDTDAVNGGLFVIPGSHMVFRTQRGPNLPKSLTEYNDTFRKYARLVPLRRGQAIIFDHKLIHCSPPNRSDQARVAIQSVLLPAEATPVHYLHDAPSGKVRAYRIDREFVLGNNLWDAKTDSLVLDHEQTVVPFPTAAEVAGNLAELAVRFGRERNRDTVRPVFRDARIQESFENDGFVRLPVLQPDEVESLKELFVATTGGSVINSDYGMYISLEEKDLDRKGALVANLARILLPKLEPHFLDCKSHLGSFLVKAPGEADYTYPHQDWTFVDSPPFVSVTVWVALVDVDEDNGNLGFVKGSHKFFDKPVGSPSPDFQTCTQGHEAALYEYLEFVPLRAGEAVAFDNRTIHGATPNRTAGLRLAAAIGMTPREARLHHYFLCEPVTPGAPRKVAKLNVDAGFFERNTVAGLKQLFDSGQFPSGCETAEIFQDDFLPFSAQEIVLICEKAGLSNNGRRLVRQASPPPSPVTGMRMLAAAVAGRIWRSVFGS